MADSYKLVILKKLTAVLQSITPANGYEFDLSACVYRGRNLFGAEVDNDLIVSITDAARSGDGIFVGQNEEKKEDWYILILGVAEDDIDNPTDRLFNLGAEIENRLLQIPTAYQGITPPEGYLLDNMIEAIKVLPYTVRPPQEVGPKAFLYQPIILTIVRP